MIVSDVMWFLFCNHEIIYFLSWNICFYPFKCESIKKGLILVSVQLRLAILSFERLQSISHCSIDTRNARLGMLPPLSPSQRLV